MKLRRVIYLAVPLSVVAAIGTVRWIPRGSPPSRPVMMIQLPAPGRAVLVGRSPGNFTPWLVQLTTAEGDPVAQVTATVEPDGRLEAVFDGLAAGTAYRFVASRADDAGGRPLLTGGFRTGDSGATARERPCRLLVFGDSGSGDANQSALAALMPDLRPDLILHTGDLVYLEGRYEWYDAKFFQPYAQLLSLAPFFPCPGNHDSEFDEGRPYYRTFVLPENGPPGATASEQHYWFDHGGMRIVSLDSNPPFEHLRDVVAPWLDGVLAEAPGPWKIVLFHHPPYTHGKYPPSGKLRELLVPVFDRHGVGLVINGHNHMYECTYPMRGGRIVPEGQGTVYLVSGAGGGELYEAGPAAPAYLRKQVAGQFSFTVLDVHAGHVDLQQINLRGDVVDSARILAPLPAGTDAQDAEVHS